MLATAAAVLTTAPAAFAATLGPDQPWVTPAAKPGSDLAARADLSRE